MEDKIIIKKIESFSISYYNKLKSDPNIWKNHILLTRKFAIRLARIEKADKFVVEVAALLHDIGKYKGEKNHALLSARLSENFMRQLKIPKLKRDLITKCILLHNSKFSKDKNKMEVKIIQSADLLGTLFNKNWQRHKRKILPKEILLSSYKKTKENLNLRSARRIAAPQIKRLKGLA